MIERELRVWIPAIEPRPVSTETWMGYTGPDDAAVEYVRQKHVRADELPPDYVVHVEDGEGVTEWSVEAEVTFRAKMLHPIPPGVAAALPRPT